MKTFFFRGPLAVATTILVAGCQTTSGDPNTGGLGGGLVGVFGGGYQERLDEKNQSIEQLEREGQMLNQRLKKSQAERAKVETQRVNLLNQLEQLNASLTRSQTLLQSETLGKQIDKQSLRELRAKQQRLETTLRELSKLSMSFLPVSSVPVNGFKAEVDAEIETQNQREIKNQTRMLEKEIEEHNNLIDRLFKHK